MKLSDITDVTDVCETCEKYLSPCNLLAEITKEIDDKTGGNPQLSLEVVEEVFARPEVVLEIAITGNASMIRQYNSLKKHYQALIEISPSLPQS